MADDRPTVRAAGGVVWRHGGDGDGDGVEVALVHRPRYDDWSLPKGKLETGEPWVAGACREVLEETGLRVVAGRRLGESRYRTLSGGREVRKRVRWWSLRAVDGSFAPTDEVDVLRWLSPQRALKALSAGYDTEPLRQFTVEPPLTTTLLLVRHGRAGSREHWDGEDDRRPLDDKGVAQAEVLSRLLPAYDPERLLSAPLLRCLDTVRPLAAARGTAVEPDPLLSAAAYERAADPTYERLRVLVDGTTPGRAVVACTQGEVLPDVLVALAREGRAQLPSELEAPKGCVWALSFAPDGCLVDADLTADPLD